MFSYYEFNLLLILTGNDLGRSDGLWITFYNKELMKILDEVIKTLGKSEMLEKSHEYSERISFYNGHFYQEKMKWRSLITKVLCSGQFVADTSL